MHPICPHAHWLYSKDPDSFLDRGETEKRCNEIGQEIFDHYKKAKNENTEAGKAAVIRICDAARCLTTDGVVRASHIEAAWNGIGDDSYHFLR